MNKYTTVDAFMTDLPADKHAQVELLQHIIREVHGGLEEHIKWNSPSYVLDGEDRLTFNLQNKEGVVKLVLHMGATRPEDKKGTPIMPDDEGLMTWQSDIRGVMSFAGLDDLKEKQAKVKTVISRWLAIG